MQINTSLASNLSGIDSNYSSITSATQTTDLSGTSDFMQMLLSQLTHQNPMEPMKDTEMLSQMAQLESVQQLQGMNQNMLAMVQVNLTGYAASLIGKHVKATENDKTYEGTITGITFDQGNMLAHIGDQSFSIGSIIDIEDQK